MKSDSDKWTFFWSDAGEESGEGAGCIKSPKDGTCGCEFCAVEAAQMGWTRIKPTPTQLL
jgi:hypothetical protein